MNLETYPIEEAAPLMFTFVSKGEKGDIFKVIRYDLMGEGVYNLGFGDWNADTQLVDDKVSSNNGDVRKVMATVIQTLPLFFEHHPNEIVFFRGSDQRRTDFYRRIIVMYYTELKDNYLIEGVTFKDEIETVQSKKSYQYFTIQKK